MKIELSYINLEDPKVCDYCNEEGLVFTCNENMNIECEREDFIKLRDKFPYLDWAEVTEEL